MSPMGLLQPLPIPERIWGDISMDFVKGLPKSAGTDTIFVFVDRLNKYAHFIVIAHLFSTKSIAAVFIIEVVYFHGFSHSIVFDRDKVFISNFWIELFHL